MTREAARRTSHDACLTRARARAARRLVGALGALSLAGVAVGWRAAAPRL